jgi:hypothetical protein
VDQRGPCADAKGNAGVGLVVLRLALVGPELLGRRMVHRLKPYQCGSHPQPDNGDVSGRQIVLVP